ncbi:MAG: hypothetical protein IT564_00045 [Rhodospirillales bacterium]|nr:hypothetical protein [Rhodospirillales bacterium]
MPPYRPIALLLALLVFAAGARAQAGPAGDVRSLPGVGVWGFVVDDGDSEPALSAERPGEIVAARLSADGAPPAWRAVVRAREVMARHLADHWHIFAHGAHWIVFSTDRGSFLLKLDRNFRRLLLVPVSDATLPTNDMFMVAEPDGIAVGHFLPGTGHLIFRMTRDGAPGGTVVLGGGEARHANGASALAVPGGFRVIAPQTLQPDMPGGLLAIEADRDWRIRSARILVSERDRNVAMGSAVHLPDGRTILHARVRKAERAPSPPAPGATPGGRAPRDDGGEIVRYWIGANGGIVRREVVVADQKANRPHTALIGGMLYTLWDTSGAVWLKTERIR